MTTSPIDPVTPVTPEVPLEPETPEEVVWDEPMEPLEQKDSSGL